MPISKVITPIISRVITSVIATIRRYFPTLDGVAGHFVLSKPVVFTGEFKVTFKTSTTATSTQAIIGSIASDDITMLAGGNLRVADGVSAVVFTTAINDGEFHQIEIKRLSNVVELFIDGVSDGSGALSSTFEVDFFGQDASANFFTGTPADVVLTDLSGAEPITQTYLLNKPPGAENDIELPLENVFGSEEWDESPLLWVGSEPSFTRKGAGTASISALDLHVITYKVELSLGGLRYSTATHSGPFRTTAGTFTEILPIGETNPQFQNSGAPSTIGTVSDISVRSITNALTRESVAETDVELMTKQPNGDFLGVDRVLNGGPFIGTANWGSQLGAILSESSGELTVESTGANSLGFQNLTGFNLGDSVEINIFLISETLGTQFSFGGEIQALSLGLNTFTVNGITNFKLDLAPDTGGTSVFSLAKAERILQAP